MNNNSQIFGFDNSFAREMEGFFADIDAEKAPSPKLVALNLNLAKELNLDPEMLKSKEGVEIFAGNLVPSGAHPLAQAYAGHQFGGFSPSLGDGRALLLGEIVDETGRRRDIQLKGSGRTPFSRNGDGKAALGPVLREHLFSEAMHALGIPTTRSLAVVATGDEVFREKPLPGAILTRVASSHLRVGTFQFFAARGQTGQVRKLADYAISRHAPNLEGKVDKYLAFLDHVITHQAGLIARWMSVGFIHGVMNTDNMTISGETIDYGPCAFMDTYHPDTVFSSIDDNGRYAYNMQPIIAQWNLARLAESLLVLFDPGDRDQAVRIATGHIESASEIYETQWQNIMRPKLGLEKARNEDAELVNDLLSVMEKGKADFTQTFRMLSLAVEKDDRQFLELFDGQEDILAWLRKWRARLKEEHQSLSGSVARMNAANPVYVPRNHQVEHVLQKAVDENDLRPFEEFLELLKHPFDTKPGMEAYETSAPSDFGPHITYCGT